jgi:hypothetical protein
MPTVLYEAILSLSGRAIRFEKPDTEAVFKITEAAAEACGDKPHGVKYVNALQKETVLSTLRQITARPVALVYKDEPLFDGENKPVEKDGKAVTRQVVDEEATLQAIRSDEDAITKGTPWVQLGHLEMITEASANHWKKLLPDAAEFAEVYSIIERAGAKKRLPLSGRARMVVTG